VVEYSEEPLSARMATEMVESRGEVEQDHREAKGEICDKYTDRDGSQISPKQQEEANRGENGPEAMGKSVCPFFPLTVITVERDLSF